MSPPTMKAQALHPPRWSPAMTPTRLGCLAVSMLWLLAACSKPANAPTKGTAPPAPAYTAVARGKIDIEGGLLSLSMPREGTLAKVAVHEGDRVKQGQLLAALDTAPATLAVDGAQAQLEQAQAQLKLLDIQQPVAKQRAERLTAAVAAGAGDGQSADDAREAARQIATGNLNVDLHVQPGDAQRLRRHIDRRHAARGPFGCDGECNRPAAGAEVEDRTLSVRRQ